MLINNYVFSKVIKSIKKVDFLFSNILITDRENTKNIFRKWELSRTKKNWSPANLPAHTSLFIKKKIINKIGLYNEKFKISSDFDYMIRLFKIKNIRYKFLNKTLVIMRSGGLSSSLKNLPTRIGEDLKILKIHFKKNYLVLYFLKISKKIFQFF